MKPIRLITGFVTVGGWTMASRLLGFARDILLAVFLGAGPVAEAFLVAFALPNMFRRFFAEGAFNMAFVPMFSKRVDDPAKARAFAQEAFSGLGFVLLIFSAAGVIAMPLLVMAMAAGFAGDVRFELAVEFGRVCFFYILFISLAALLTGVLNAVGHFAAGAAAPVVLNVILVAALVLAQSGLIPVSPRAGEIAGLHSGRVLVWGVLAAGIGQFLLMWWIARRHGFRMGITRPRLSPDMRQLVRVAVPAALAGGVVQINLLVGRQVASYFDGAVAWLAYADRLYQLPLGVVGIAVGVVLLPDLSRRLAAGDEAGSRHGLSRAGEFALALTLPATAALIAIPGPLVSVLFERGAFDASDSAATALAVAVYGAGLPAFVLQKVMQPLYFAREDTVRPFRYAVWAMVINAGVAIGLAPFIGFIAAAWGTTLAGWAMVGLLWWGARDMGLVAKFDDRLRRRIPRQVLASAIMGGVLVIAAGLLRDMLATGGWRYLALLGLVVLGMVSYAIASHLTGAFTLRDLKSATRRG
ncbi:murein biosynthesis integral membrane protein MurJ [Mangrovicoccus algicola]|uniref:Probable lipid II flippase MurJ n=1 Tax=Mangrovicoccus algicola TaxID=2771008 RepID=A0A8J6Z8W4_9RHOB|nr:murein biosynthesis integral membrane protein MurJ [Mangrovicoccus algicola]MBE3638036.1 murein biosynthesis integral membrane protein MurJ [Mangrovicoccus algicola]